MAAFNVVRFKVKPEHESAFVAHHRGASMNIKGMRQFALIKTGDRAYCVIGEWDKFANLAGARPQMIGMLDSMRHMLEDLGAGLGLTDPVSGEAVVVRKARAARPAKKKAAKRKKK